MPEAGLQGQVPVGLRAAGFTGFRCNLELVSQVQGEGASWQHASYGDCSYYDTKGDTSQAHLGTVVVDAADSRKPVVTDYLSTAAMIDPWESLKVNQARGLLAGVQQPGVGFTVYDIKTDCRHPKMLSDISIDGVQGHEGTWAPDGLTYYGSDVKDFIIYPIDVVDPSKPKVLIKWPFPGAGNHGLSISKDGRRAYFVQASTGATGPVRVYDIRDPRNPKEIAYYNPPARSDKQNSLPGSQHIGAKVVDWASSMPRIRADRGEIWFTSQDGGFQIVRFTNGVWPFKN